MASLEKRGDTYRVKFRYGGRQFGCPLKTTDPNEAADLMGRLADNLRLVERGKLEVPLGADLGLFLLSDGKLNAKPQAERVLRLGEFFKQYRDSTNGKEPNTRYTEKIHMAHLERLLGVRQIVQGITNEMLQGYVNSRGKEEGQRGPISCDTIKKEIGTFSSIWNKWGKRLGLVKGDAPTRGLIYTKAKGKPPFQTWDQIERKISRGGLTDEQIAELWECLFLDAVQVGQLLKHVLKAATVEWLYPMAVFVAYTGVRRSEAVRSEIDDLDFDGKRIQIREKKKDQSKEMTFRHVPMAHQLETAMRKWLAKHPGGQRTFVQDGNAISGQVASNRLKEALAGSKWEVVRGWHIFRHSFISNAAAVGVDQRTISAWAGHMTAEMEARYRHLFPKKEQEDLSRMFGSRRPVQMVTDRTASPGS